MLFEFLKGESTLRLLAILTTTCKVHRWNGLSKAKRKGKK